MRRRRSSVLFVLLAGLAVVVAGVVVVVHLTSTPAPPPLTPAQRAAAAARAAARRLLATERRDVAGAEKLVSIVPPTGTEQPVPNEDGALFAAPLPSHEVVSFVPYYLMDSLEPDDLADSSVVVYSSLCIGASGTISQSGVDCSNGWNDLHSPTFADLVANAHADGDRVLVSLSAFTSTAIAAFLAHPAASGAALAASIEPIVAADGLDGVNLDVEGSSPTIAGDYVSFVTAFASAARAADPSGQIILDAFADSAAPGGSFFDVKALARLVDRIFIEAYQMDDPTVSSANSPLSSSTLGYSAVQSLVQYEKVAPAKELILGLPFYGLDFTTVGPAPGAAATAAGPESFNYSAIVEAERTPKWDGPSSTPYASFKKDGSWHQLWYDDPLSIALKVALAAHLGTAGVGAWALGMDAGSSAMLEALTGDSPPLRAAATP